MDFKELQVYAEPAPQLPEQRLAAWTLIGRGKMVMDDKLRRHSLVLQGITAGHETKDQPSLAEAIKLYRATFKSMETDRKDFTVFIDECKKQCMKFETEYNPETNEIFKAMTERELKLREDAANALTAANDKLNESVAFRTHMINEYQALACSYRDQLALIVHQAYTTCLVQKVPTENVTPAINAAVAAMRVTKPRDLVKYQRVHLPDAEALAIVQALKQPSYTDIFNEYLKELTDKFSMYANDLANAEQALANQNQLFESETTTNATNDQAEKEANTLYLQATAQILTAAPGMKPVTEVSQIKIMGESKEWTARIMAAFLANFNATIEKVRTKKDAPNYATLSIERMAAALDAAGVRVDGLEYEAIKK